MQAILNWLVGKRTIISAVAGAAWTALYSQGVIDQKTFEAGAAIAGFAGLVFMRLAISKPVAHLDIVPITAQVPAVLTSSTPPTPTVPSSNPNGGAPDVH